MIEYSNSDWEKMTLDKPDVFCEAVWSAGCRIMLDPAVVDDHHTNWTEVVKDSDQVQFRKQEKMT